MSLAANAEAVATRAHAGQFRRDGVTPYIEHPRAVVSRIEGDELSVAAAWLHDVLEDTDETAESLAAQGIPQAVIDAVVLLTKPPNLPYEKYLANVAENPIARAVKIADMLSNLADRPTLKQIRKYSRGLLMLVGDDDKESALVH